MVAEVDLTEDGGSRRLFLAIAGGALTSPPVPPPFNSTDSIEPRAAFVDVAPSIEPIIDPYAGKGSSTGGGDDRNAVPILRIEPNYPPRALQQGIEGYVDLSFTITSVGTTSNVEVTRSVPPYVFDREAVRAVRRWRYNPTLAQSSGIARTSESVRLEFELPRQGRR